METIWTEEFLLMIVSMFITEVQKMNYTINR